MAVTPFIKPIQNRYGMMYTFQSSIEDITLAFSQNNRKFRFSKFALLRIPEFGVPNDKENKCQFLAVGETPMEIGINTADYNVNLANSFQDYCLNMESILLSQSTYNADAGNTVAERVFFKWLKEMGAIRYRDANSLEKDGAILPSEDRFVEEDEYNVGITSPVNYNYNRVVKYIGDIEVTHSVKRDNTYTEIYIYVPTNVGTTPYVMFKSGGDENYVVDHSYFNDPTSALDVEYLCGRHYTDVHPFALETRAFYDLDDGDIYNEISDSIDTPVFTQRYWFSGAFQDAYYTDQSFGDSDNQLVRKTNLGDSTSVQYIRNKLDGVTIDFDLGNYKLANENSDVKVLTDFNAYVGTKDFQYNAVLIYYDVIDIDNPDNTYTNLYGIQFLNEVEDSGLEFAIPYITKYKPNVLSKTNGNSFAHKVNIKSDTSVNLVPVEKSINDYTTFSMDLFVDALTQMRLMTDSYEKNLQFITDTMNEVDTLKNLMLDDTNSSEILIRIENIEASLEASTALFSNTDAVMKMIQDLYYKYTEIINGETTVDVRYNLDPVVINDVVKHPQEFDLTSSFRGNIVNNTTLELVKYSNYFRHENSSIAVTLNRDLVVDIDDTLVAWSNGQTFEVVFHDIFDPAIYGISFYTDALNKTGSGAFGKLVCTFDAADDFVGSDYTPTFRIMCVDATNLEFIVDKIR